MNIKKLFVIPLLIIFSAGCSSLILHSADYSWPIENVLKVDDNGFVTEDRHTFTINVKPLFFKEFADSNSAAGKEIRIIRNNAGYYFITGAGFKNVYVFLPVENGMKLDNTISISENQPLSSPVLNQKSPYIELIDGSTKYLLNNKGIVR